MPTTRRPSLTSLPGLILVALVPAASGCGGDGAGAGRGGDRSDGSASAAIASDTVSARRSAERQGTVRIEGMAIPLRLFHTGDDFPLPFSAYVPSDVAAGTSGRAEYGGASVHFYANSAGQRNEEAFLHLFVFPPGTIRAEALAAARSYATGAGAPVIRGTERLLEHERAIATPWAIRAYRFRYRRGAGWFVGFIGTGEHGGRFYRLVEHYPAEHGDGFTPRAAVILSTWRWADGAPLLPRKVGP